MKIEKIKKRMVEETFVLDTKFLCDQCKKELHDDRSNIHTNKVVFKRGYSYGGDSADIDSEMAYFCDECAEKLRYFLSQNGVVLTKENMSY